METQNCFAAVDVMCALHTGKQFSRLHNLNGHVHMHKGTKPHVCFCGASFTLKGQHYRQLPLLSNIISNV